MFEKLIEFLNKVLNNMLNKLNKKNKTEKSPAGSNLPESQDELQLASKQDDKKIRKEISEIMSLINEGDRRSVDVALKYKITKGTYNWLSSLVVRNGASFVFTE